MTACERARGWIHPYLDGELPGYEQLVFEAHLLECDNCRSEYEAVRHVVETVRGSSPLYPAAASLAGKLNEMLQDNHLVRRKRTRARAAVMAATFAATILVVAMLPALRTQRFTSFAADTHSRYAQGSISLAVSSDQPAIVSEWLQDHLPFHLELPNFPLQPGESKSYSLVGASLMRFGGQDVAYLAYTMQSRPISLLVSSSANVLPSRGEAYSSGKLVFHFSAEKGLKLITWKDRGLSYALVSDVQVEGAQSCIVCHGSERERQKFENLLRLESLPQ